MVTFVSDRSPLSLDDILEKTASRPPQMAAILESLTIWPKNCFWGSNRIEKRRFLSVELSAILNRYSYQSHSVTSVDKIWVGLERIEPTNLDRIDAPDSQNQDLSDWIETRF